jgi:hypothetical protein
MPSSRADVGLKSRSRSTMSKLFWVTRASISMRLK